MILLTAANFDIMTLQEIKQALTKVDQIQFVLPGGVKVPNHFHVTEVGSIRRHFIDCGGTMRDESVINFQLYTSTDYDHRLGAQKLKSIIELSENKLALDNLDIEVEYQGDTIGKYGLDFDGSQFLLTPTQTDCLAKDSCGIPTQKPRIRLTTIGATQDDVCEPGSGCC